MTKKTAYLGDGAYAAHDGERVKLYTSDGISETNVVWLEPEVAQALVRFLKHCGMLDVLGG